MKLETYHYIAIGLMAALAIGGGFLLLKCRSGPSDADIKELIRKMDEERLKVWNVVRKLDKKDLPGDLYKLFGDLNNACNALYKAVNKK